MAVRPKPATAVERLRQPLRGEVQSRNKRLPVIPPVEVENLVLRGEKVDVNIIQAVTGGELERTIEGASTVTLNLHDPGRELLTSKLLNREGNIDLKVDRFWFRLVAFSKQGPELTLTFEDREVAWLRTYKKPKRAFRDNMTRAEFVLSMVRDVKEATIPVYIPELHTRQPIDGKAGAPGTTVKEITKASDRPKEKDEERGRGLAKNAKLSGKGTLTPYKLHNAERVLNVAASLGAPERATLALLTACIVEAPDFANPTGGHSTSVGILQLLDLHLGGSVSESGGRRDIELVVKLFLTTGFWGKGGAIANAKQNPSWSVGQIAQQSQGSGVPGAYDIYASQARKILAAFGGATGGTDPGGTRTFERTTVKRYSYTRGTVKKKESSWAAARRLAEEVNWRAFVVEGRFYFVSEEDLYASRPRMVLSEDSPGVQSIDFDIDENMRVHEATITCRADLWAADPGTVVEIEGMGPADDRWLVASMRRSIWDRNTEISLRKPLREKPEPAPETATDKLSVGVPDRRAPGGNEGGVGTGDLQSPFGGKFPVTDVFGSPRSYGGHLGADIGTPHGTPCIAPFNGTITYSATTGFSGGGMIHLQAAGGIPRFMQKGAKIGWGHVSGTNVRSGQRVKAGDRVGTSGTSDNGAPHVHFIFLRGGGNTLQGDTDPVPLLRKLGGV